MSDEEPQAPPVRVYVRCDPPIPVEVENGGAWYAGVALAYWGERVTARWTTDVGSTFQQTVDAARVRRGGSSASGGGPSAATTGSAS